MKYLLFIFAVLGYSISVAQSIDTTMVNYDGTDFYHIRCDTHSKVLVFLHGGVHNPVFDDSTETVDLTLLLEGNTNLIPYALRNGFDVVIPVTNDSMNWLTNHRYCRNLINAYLRTQKTYNSQVISGFSDGGTGSFKIFYDYADSFDGLVVFNGYPQHDNFYQTVNYNSIREKKVIFFSTFQDKRIPYEFLLTEYSKQKQTNANTFFYVKDGQHSFDEYGEHEMNICMNILTSKIRNSKHQPIHAYMEEDKVIAFYPFRKKIWKKFGYGKDDYLLNQKQYKTYGKD